MKEKAVEKLKENGYDAFIEDGVLMVNIKSQSIRDCEKQKKEIKNLISEIGYDGSLGWKVRFEK